MLRKVYASITVYRIQVLREALNHPRRALGRVLMEAFITLWTAFAAVGMITGYIGITPLPRPVCIVVHANGAPAPSSCSNPDAYQVTP